MVRMTRYVLVVSGIEALGASGLYADIRAAQIENVWPIALPTAVTLQSFTPSYRYYKPVPAGALLQSLRAAVASYSVHAIKIGMIANESQVRALMCFIKHVRTLPLHVPIVLDPVLFSSSGIALYQGRLSVFIKLLHMVDVITPNKDESLAIINFRKSNNSAVFNHPTEVLYKLHQQGFLRVLLKGGHWPACDGMISDYFSERGHLPIELKAQRQPLEVRGTGCALSSRFASHLALGDDFLLALKRAHAWLHHIYPQAVRLEDMGMHILLE